MGPQVRSGAAGTPWGRGYAYDIIDMNIHIRIINIDINIDTIIAYCLLPIAYCLLSIAYCPLPIGHCLLLMSFIGGRRLGFFGG